MQKRKRIITIILLAVVAVGAGFYVWRSREPEYKGVRLGVWLDDVNRTEKFWHTSLVMTNQGSETVKQAREAAQEAVREIGSRAVPYIVSRLKGDESKWRVKYRSAFPSLPTWAQKILPEPRKEFTKQDANTAFLKIGPVIKRELIDLLKDESSSVRSVAAHALGSFRFYNGTDIRDAIPELTVLLKDGDVEVCQAAVMALGYIGPDAGNAVSAIIPLLSASEKGPNPGQIVFLHSAAARTLGKIGPKAESAVPALMVLLQDSNAYNRNVAAVAIWRISGDVTNTLPVLIKGLDEVQEGSIWEVVEGLEEMGPQAKEAVPALIGQTKGVKRSVGGMPVGSYSLRKITNALVKIDPEEADKVFGKGK